jgi:hypothetical protein
MVADASNDYRAKGVSFSCAAARWMMTRESLTNRVIHEHRLVFD